MKSAFEAVRELMKNGIDCWDHWMARRGAIECVICGSLHWSFDTFVSHGRDEHPGESYLPYKRH